MPTRFGQRVAEAMLEAGGIAGGGVQEANASAAALLPDGTVTILFSDIENLTGLTERLGDGRTQDVLRSHWAIIREQLASHRGHEVKTLGDGFMVAFSSARGAVFCAIAVQRALAAYNAQHPAEPIRVRIGLHTGEVIRESDDFFGWHVNLAARIAAEARGGQILVSSLLKELTESAGDIQFGEGRPVDLRGISGIRHVHEVLWGDPGSLVTSHCRRRQLRACASELRRVRLWHPRRRCVFANGRARVSRVAAAEANVFRCEGEYWTIAYEGKVCLLRDTKGLRDIAHLVRHPGQQFDSQELAREPETAPACAGAAAQAAAEELAVTDLGDAGTILDPRAKAAYKRRIDELREELAEAERLNDPGQAAAARQEIEVIARQLSAAIGLGGRDRRAAWSVERARQAVTQRISTALENIRRQHPLLADHLDKAIKRGRFCAYNPDPARPVAWSWGSVTTVPPR